MPLPIEGDAPVTAKIKAAITAETGEAKFAWIDGLLEGSVTSKSNTRKLGKFDRMITHRIWGKPVVVLTVLLGLIGSFIPALPFMVIVAILAVMILHMWITSKIFGLGWKTFMAFIASSIGKEGAIGVLSTIFTDHSMLTVGGTVAGGAVANINELLVANVGIVHYYR